MVTALDTPSRQARRLLEMSGSGEDDRSSRASIERSRDATSRDQEIWQILEQVLDPEIPVVSVVDLGIVRDVRPDRVTITPTYTGCPATQVIERDIRDALDSTGFRDVAIETVLSPPWTTDWITEHGKAKLHAYGIAPPSAAPTAICPQCGSADTEEVSRFGSTPCKAQWRCRACLEPFDRFKCH